MAIAAVEGDANTAVSARQESGSGCNEEGRNVTYCSSVLATALFTTEAREGLISLSCLT